MLTDFKRKSSKLSMHMSRYNQKLFYHRSKTIVPASLSTSFKCLFYKVLSEHKVFRLIQTMLRDSYLTEEEQGAILAYKEQKLRIVEIVRKLGRFHKVVLNFYVVLLRVKKTRMVHLKRSYLAVLKDKLLKLRAIH